jgi:hypothetical protein
VCGGPVRQSPQVKDLIERMLHPDPLQRATLSRVRKHPWAAPVVPAVYKSISEPKDCALLISDDPTKDLYEGALRKVRYRSQDCAVLCCAVLCCAVLCCAVLCCAVLCCAVLCCVL